MKKTLKEFRDQNTINTTTLEEGYSLRLISRFEPLKKIFSKSKGGFGRYHIVHNKTGEVVGTLKHDRYSNDHFIKIHGQDHTVWSNDPVASSDPQTTLNKFIKALHGK